jgi:hypothetical protein
MAHGSLNFATGVAVNDELDIAALPETASSLFAESAPSHATNRIEAHAIVIAFIMRLVSGRAVMADIDAPFYGRGADRQLRQTRSGTAKKKE